MADQPESVSLNLFLAALGILITLIVASFGVVGGAFNKVWEYIVATKKEIWDNIDAHAKTHVRESDIGDLRNLMQGTELRTYAALEKMEFRIMERMRTMEEHVHLLTTELAQMRGRSEQHGDYGRSGRGDD